MLESSQSDSLGGPDHANGRRRSLSSTNNTDGFELIDKSWHVATDVPSDILVQVGDISFHLHKYPLLSRSGRINKIMCETRDPDLSKVVFHDLPGGAGAFEMAAKFCYGIAVDLTATNISGLRSAAEYLEMSEDMEQGNLVFKTEAFLSYAVLSSWRDSILVLKSCEGLSPWPENLNIVRRCSESIAWKVCASPRGVNDSSPRHVPLDWWFEDVSILRIDHFVRVINAIKTKGVRFELIGAAIMHYAGKWVSEEMAEAKDQRMIIEGIVSITPPQKDSVSCSFLLGLLRATRRLEMAQDLVAELERRVGMQLEQATLADLLIPPYNTSETSSCSCDVDLVQRLLEHFLVGETTERNATVRVARIIDSYLTEVSRDGNLSLTKFQELAEALPEVARSCDDGMYRAIDSYLKAHPTLPEPERRRLCRAMDCQKLSIDACLHAAQNERLPLRVVMQVLSSNQAKISNAITNNSLKKAVEPEYQPMVSNRKILLEGTPQSFQEGWAAAKKDINVLKFELEAMNKRYGDLETDMESLRRQFEKMSKQKQLSMWSSGWKKLSKFRRMTYMENQDFDADGKRNTPRSWRNSIS